MQPQYILVNPEIAPDVSSASQQVVSMPGAYNGSYVYASASDSSVNYHMTSLHPTAAMLPNGESVRSEQNTPGYCVGDNNGGYILLPSPNISYGLPYAMQGNFNKDTKISLSEDSSANQEGGYIINSPTIAPDGSYTLVANEDGYFLLPANDDQIPFCETAKILDNSYGCLDPK